LKHKAQEAAELAQVREAALTQLNSESVCEGDRAGNDTQPALVDREKRIVELSFSSEHPYAREYGLEILDHSPGAFDMTFLNSGSAPFMVAPKGNGLHDGAVQIGSVMKASARVDSDRKGRAKVKISRSPMGDAFLNDVEDDVAVNISFGYRASQPAVTKDKATGVATVRWMKTNPREITRVPLAADNTVGIGRGQAVGDETAGGTMSPDSCPTCKGKAADMAQCSTCKGSGKKATTQGREDAANSKTEVKTLTMTAEEQRATETARMDDIMALGVRFKNETLATRCALENKSVDETRALILTAFAADQAAKAIVETREEAGAKKDEGNIVIYSSLKSFTGSRQEAGLKAYRFAKWFLAGPLGHMEGSRAVESAKTYCKDQGISLVRSQTEGEETAGGILVPHEFTNDMIDLKEKYGVFRPNVRVVPMASETKSMPRRKSGLTAYVIGEGKGAAESKKGWDRVSLSAKKIGCLARYSSELAEDGLVSIGDDLASEMAYAFVHFEDVVGFTGDGSLDMMRVTGVVPALQALADTDTSPSNIEASGNTWDEFEIAEFLAAIGRLPEYAEQGSVKWYCSKVFWATVIQRIKFGLGGALVPDVEGPGKKSFLGYPVEVSQVLPRTAANGKVACFIGNLPLAAMLGDRRRATIATSEHVHFEDEEFLIRGTERFDINVHNVQGTPAETAAGIAGPLVSITAQDS
jgi:HK97 family phage major capsid protein